MKVVLENPYNPSVEEFSYLKDSEKNRKVYIKILIVKLEYSDDAVLWNEVFQLRGSIAQKSRKELVEHYYNYHFPMYLKREIHKDCDKEFILK